MVPLLHLVVELAAEAVDAVALLADDVADLVDLLAEALALGLALELLLAHDGLEPVAERAHLGHELGALGGLARGERLARPGAAEVVDAERRRQHGDDEQGRAGERGREAGDGEEGSGHHREAHHREARVRECGPTPGRTSSRPSSTAASNRRTSVAARAEARASSGARTSTWKVSGFQTNRLAMRYA